MENSIKTQVQEILVENGLDFKIEKEGLYRIKNLELILNLENGALRGTCYEPKPTPYSITNLTLVCSEAVVIFAK